jgi:hypothetical protein
MACSVSDAPSLKDLPKVANDLKSQLEGFNTSCLKDVDTNEKIVLPSAEGLYFVLYNIKSIQIYEPLHLYLKSYHSCSR